MNHDISPPILSRIGNTPLVPLRLEFEGITIHAKCEFSSPRGGIKDRFARCVLTDAERRGLLRPDSIILERTSGDTGIALAIKARYPRARIVAMEPAEKELHAAECRCCVSIEGVAGNSFVPPLLRDAPLDTAVRISAPEAMEMTRRLRRQFGLLVGTSSGANVAAALGVARDLPPGTTIQEWHAHLPGVRLQTTP